jgi:hypothetical protein
MSEWNEVSKDPQKQGAYLVWCAKWKDYQAAYWYADPVSGHWGIAEPLLNRSFDTNYITHWTDLPAPPK